MENLMHQFLINFLSPLLLPIFMIGFLCMIAGVKPDGVISGIFSIISDLISFAFRLIQMLLSAIFRKSPGPAKRRW